MVLLGAAVLLLRGGMMLYTGGLARSKNAASTAARTLLDLSVATLSFWAIGLALGGYSGDLLLGIDAHRLIGWSGIQLGDSALLCLALIPSGIFIGATIERSRLWPMLVLTCLISGLITPLALQWLFNGWMHDLGVIDGGGGTLHLIGGVSALATCKVIGARNGKYNRDGSANFIPGHNLLLVFGGVMLMLASWAPALALFASWQGVGGAEIPMRILVSGAAAAVAGVMVSQLRYGKPDIVLIMSALLGGLVATAPGAAHLSSPASFAIGAVAGAIVPAAVIFIDLRLRIDDPTAAVAVHGVCSVWGFLGAGMFIEGSVWDRLRQVGVQAIGLVVIAVLTLLAVLIALTVLRAGVALRSKEADEFDGLDLAEHDLNAYPDFQQTMIKSYHLREA